MNVPIAQRTIQAEAPGVDTPRIAPVTEKAFGADIGAAQAQLGNTVVSGAAKLSSAIAERQNFDKEQAVHDALQPVQQEMYQKTHGEGGYATLQGLQARGATDKFSAEFMPAKEKFLKQFSDERQVALASNQYDAIYNNHLDSVISNEGRQTSVAEQQGLASAAQTASQAASVNPKVLPADNPILKAALSRTYEHNVKIFGPEIAAAKNREINDMAALERVKLFPQDAEKLMAMDLSPEGRAQVRGVQLDQMVKNDFQSLPKADRLDDGSANMAKVQQKYSTDKSLNADEAQKAFENFSSMETRAQRVLNSENDSNSRTFYSLASNPETPIDVARKAAGQYANKFRSGKVDDKDLATKLKFIDTNNKEGNGTTNPTKWNELHEGIDKDGDVTPEMILSARENGELSKSDTRNLITFLYGNKSQAIRNTLESIMSSETMKALEKSDQDRVKALITKQALETKAYTPEAYRKIADEMLKDAPTGNTSFWGKIWNKSQPIYKSAGIMSNYPDIVRAAGNTENAVNFAIRVGGLEKFENNTEYPNAVSYLLNEGWTLDNIDEVNLEKVAARLAEKKNGKP